jgi:hypothetical protein
MLGWCMVLLAGLVKIMSAKAVGWTGVAIILLQQLFGLVPKLFPKSIQDSIGASWELVYPSGMPELPGLAILDVLVPWIGVMAAGYGFGPLLLREPADRKRILLRLGLTLTALFVVAGCIVTAMSSGDGPFLFRLLNQRKYPASQGRRLL